MSPQSTNSTDVALPSRTITHGEILQQPVLWPTTLDIVRTRGWMNDSPNRPVIVTGAGTSAYAASAIASAWPNARAVPTTDLLIETREQLARRWPEFPANGVLLSLGRSGDSPESVAVVARMRKLCPAVVHVAITCNPKGQLAQTDGIYPVILDPRTNDRGLAMTSSFSNLVLAGLAMQHARELQSLLPAICNTVERRFPDLDAAASRWASQRPERIAVLGSGPLRALASEASLKILEMTAGHTATLTETFLGLRHGPMTFVTPDTLVLCFLSSSPENRRYEEDLIRELRIKRLGRILAVAPDAADTSLFDEWIPASAPNAPDELRVPFEIPFAQLLAYHLSLGEGLDPDNPSPMGAISRVVQKFVIYDENGND